MTNLQENSESMYRTIKFTILTGKKEESILEKLTRKHTFAFKRFLEIIKKEKLTTNDILTELYRLTIPSKNRPIVKYDLKKETNLFHNQLAECLRYAVCSYRAYLAKHKKWEHLLLKHSQYKILHLVHELEVNSSGKLLTVRDDMSEVVNELLDDYLINKILNSSHSFPFEGKKVQTKKIPVFFSKRIYRLEKIAGSFRLRISTLRPTELLTLNLKSSAYHLREISGCQAVGGYLYKNITKKRWEYHALVKTTTSISAGGKKAVFGIDIGMTTDATVVLLLEDNPLKQKRIHFLKVPELKKKRFFLKQRKKILQKKIATASPKQKSFFVQELKDVHNKITKNTNALCHKISKMIVDIAREYVVLGYEVHVAIGQLSGIRTRAMKGNYKGGKYRGKVHSFAYYQLTENIKYKCQKLGIAASNISTISESWTSRICHQCDSINTTRQSQASFHCLECNIKCHADVNGAINIALRYLQKLLLVDRVQIKMIYLFPNNKKSAGSSNPSVTLLDPQGIGSSPPRSESTGVEQSAQVKVEDAGKVQTPNQRTTLATFGKTSTNLKKSGAGTGN